MARGLHGGCRAKIHCFLKLGKKCFWPTSAKRGNRGVPSPLQGIICPLGGQGHLGDPPPIKGILCPLSVKRGWGILTPNLTDIEESLCTPLKAILQSLRCTISRRSVDERSVSSYRSLLVEHEIGNEIELGVAEDGEVVHERGDRVHVVGA